MELDHIYPQDARCFTNIISAKRPIVDVIITSPPYYDLKDYGVRNQIGYGQTKEQYLADVETVLRNCFQVTKPKGSLWLVIDDYRDHGLLQLLPWEISGRATNVGWKLRDLIVWDKQHTIPWSSRGHMRKVSEFILFFTKTDSYKYHIDRVKELEGVSKWWVDFPERFNPKGKTPTNIWQFPIRTQGTWPLPSKVDHHCPFPTALVARIIELTTDPGDVVMDPFAGSGIALAQAAAMRRHYLGFEINKTYIRMFEKEVKREVADEWKEMQEMRQLRVTAHKGFEQTVMKLRVLKYARQVTTPFVSNRKSRNQNNVRAIICFASIPRHFHRNESLKASVWVVVNKLTTRNRIALKKSLNLQAYPPLSQFGVEAEVKTMTMRTLRRKANLLDKEFYLYAGYRPRKHVARHTLRRWITPDLKENISESKLPLLANLAVDVELALKK